MKKYLLFVLALMLVRLPAMQQRQQLAVVAADLAALVELEEPIFLELRTGEWTTALDAALRQELLSRGADIRESGVSHSPVSVYTHTQDETSTAARLTALGLEQARLVQVTMDIVWLTVEHKSFLSYRQERKPVYNFTLRQISLPGGRLERIDSLSREIQSSVVGDRGSTRLRWFEPILASLALASMVFLLWNTE